MAKTEIQFLKERGLYGAYRKYRNIPRARVIDTAIRNFDGTIARKKVYVYKKGKTTVFRDFFNLEFLGFTRKSINKSIGRLSEKVKISKPFASSRQIIKQGDKKGEVMNFQVSFDMTVNSLQLKRSNKIRFYNKSLNNLRVVEETNRVKRRMAGGVVIRALYIKGNIVKAVTVRSRRVFMLGTKSERDLAFNDALLNGAAEAEFTPDEVIIQDYWFEYRRDTNAALIEN